jgi:hypothetical protein
MITAVFTMDMMMMMMNTMIVYFAMSGIVTRGIIMIVNVIMKDDETMDVMLMVSRS